MDDNQQPQPNNTPQDGVSPPNPSSPQSQPQVQQQPSPQTVLAAPAQPLSTPSSEPTQPQVSGPTVIGPQMSQPLTDSANPVATQQPMASSTSTSGASAPAQPTVGPSPMPSDPPVMPVKEKSKGRKLLIPIIVGALLLLGGGAAAYNSIVLNSPEGIWKKAMSNTSRGFDELVKVAAEDPAKGGTVEGSFKLSSPIALDGSVNGKWYENDSEYKLDVGFAGFRPTLELKTISPSEGTSPDLYIKLEDISGLQAMLGAGDPSVGQLLSAVDGNWFVVDHTLYEQALVEGQSDGLELSEEDIKQIGDNISSVLRERLFTDDSEKAVFVVDEPIGKEDFEDDSAYKYKVVAQKEQTKDFVRALVESLKSTKVEEIVLGDSADTSLDDYLNTDELVESIEQMDFSSATADVWVSLDTKLVRNVRITPDSQDGETGYIDIGMPYNGGDEIPFRISVVYEHSNSESKANASIEFSYNQSTKAVKAGFNLDINEGSDKIVAEGSMTATPSDEEISIETPTGARNIYELLGFLYGGYGGPQLDALPGGTLGDNTDVFELPELPDIPFLDTLQL